MSQDKDRNERTVHERIERLRRRLSDASFSAPQAAVIKAILDVIDDELGAKP